MDSNSNKVYILVVLAKRADKRQGTSHLYHLSLIYLISLPTITISISSIQNHENLLEYTYTSPWSVLHSLSPPQHISYISFIGLSQHVTEFKVVLALFLASHSCYTALNAFDHPVYSSMWIVDMFIDDDNVIYTLWL